MALVKMTVNGQAVEHDVPDNTLLVSFIRETLGLTEPMLAVTQASVEHVWCM